MADDQNSVSSSTSRLLRSQESGRGNLEHFEVTFESSTVTAATTTTTTTPTTTTPFQEGANINGPSASFSVAALSSGDLNRVSSSNSCLMLDSEQQVAASETLTTTSAATTTTNPEIITTRPLILITDLNSPTSSQGSASCLQGVTSSSHYYDYSKTQHKEYNGEEENENTSRGDRNLVGRDGVSFVEEKHCDELEDEEDEEDEDEEQEDEEQVEEIDGIRYRIVAAVTTKQRKKPPGGRKGRPKQDDGRVSSKAIKSDRGTGYEIETETGSSAAAASAPSTKSALNSYKQQQHQQQPYRTNQGQPVDRPKVVIMVAGSCGSKVDKDYHNNSCIQDVNYNYSSTDRTAAEHFKSASSATNHHHNFADQQCNSNNNNNNHDGENNNPSALNNKTKKTSSTDLNDDNEVDDEKQQSKLSKHNTRRLSTKSSGSRLSFVRRKSSAFVANLLQTSSLQATSNNELGPNMNSQQAQQKLRRLSIYEMTKSPPPETSLEIYLSERRRSSTVSSKHVQQQLAEQQSTFETNYCQRQQYFKDLNQKLINQDKKLLNVVANRGQIHRHSVDIAQLPLVSAAAKGSKSRTAANGGSKHQEVVLEATNQEVEDEDEEEAKEGRKEQTFVEGQTNKQIIEGPIGALPLNDRDKSNQLSRLSINQSRNFHNSSSSLKQQQTDKICLTEQVADSKFDGDSNHHFDGHRDGQIQLYKSKQQQPQTKHQLAAIKEDGRRYLMGK